MNPERKNFPSGPHHTRSEPVQIWPKTISAPVSPHEAVLSQPAQKTIEQHELILPGETKKTVVPPAPKPRRIYGIPAPNFHKANLVATPQVELPMRIEPGPRPVRYPQKLAEHLGLHPDKIIAARTPWRLEKPDAVDFSVLQRMTSDDFENWVAVRLAHLGYVSFQTQKTRDGGIDIFAVNPDGPNQNAVVTKFLNYERPRVEGPNTIGIDAKHWVGNVGKKTVDELIGACATHLNKPEHIAVITLSKFTTDAEEIQRRTKTLSLIGWQHLQAPHLWFPKKAAA